MSWKDIDINFSKDASNDINTVEDEEAIAQSILNCVMVGEGENLCDVYFGMDISEEMNQFATSPVLNSIKNKITNAVDNYEPRVNIKNVDFQNADNKTLAVKIYYTISNNKNITYDVSFNIERSK